MIIEESFRVAAPLIDVAAFLVDADRMSRCVPGVTGVEETADHEYRATLQARLGPVSAAFQGSLRLDDSRAPHRLTAQGQGRDQRSGSQAKVDFVADLEEDGDGTVVRISADVTIRGRLGQFGTGVIASTARELVREFSECVNRTLSRSDAESIDADDRPRSASLTRVGSRGLWSWLVGLVRSAWQRLGGRFGGGGGAEQ